MSLRLYGWMKEEKKCSELLISPQKNQSRMKEETKKMNTKQKLSPSVYGYVLGVYKGSGESLGNIAAQARIFELDMNTFIDVLNFREELER